MKSTTEAPPPVKKYLTQDEVDALPEGAEITILWSGGNGPHKYIVGKHEGKSFTTFIASDDSRHLGERIDFVGNKKPYTLAWIPVSH